MTYKWPFPAHTPRSVVTQEPEVSKIILMKTDGSKEEIDIPPPVFKEAPSGTILAHTGIGSNWVMPYELARVCKALYGSSTTRHLDWLGQPGCKYLGIRIDMRTGHFIITSDIGRVDGDDSILSAFGLKTQEDVLIPHSNC